MGFQFPQGRSDAGLALGEPLRQGLDRHIGAGGQGLDVRGQADRRQAQLAVLGEVVADLDVALGLPVFLVHDTGPRNAVRGARGRAKLLFSHGKFLLPQRRGPRAGLHSRTGAVRVYGVVESQTAR